MENRTKRSVTERPLTKREYVALSFVRFVVCGRRNYTLKYFVNCLCTIKIKKDTAQY